MEAASTTPVSVRSRVASRARNVIVSGPPTTPTASDVMPTTAATAGSIPVAGETKSITLGECLAEERPEKKGREEKAATEAGAQRNSRGDELQR